MPHDFAAPPLPSHSRLSFVKTGELQAWLRSHFSIAPSRVAVLGATHEILNLAEQATRQALTEAFGSSPSEFRLWDLGAHTLRQLIGSGIESDELVIAVSDPSNSHLLARMLVHEVLRKGPIVFLSDSYNTTDWPCVPFENPRPILSYLFPCAGTNRIRGSLNHLFELLNWRQHEFCPYRNNSWYLNRHRDERGAFRIDQNDHDQAIKWHMRSSDICDYVIVHDPFNPQVLEDSNISLIVLMRDPRDILNSYFHHVRKEFTSSDEDTLLHIMRGYYRSLSEKYHYCLRWPSITEIVENYRWTLSNPNSFIVRFEDLRTDGAGQLRNLLFRLGLYPNPFVNLNDAEFERAAHLGTFEHQSGGTMKEGEDRKEFSGVMRKGVVGDWKNSFTPRVVREFKEMTGDGLFALGYETDPNWGV